MHFERAVKILTKKERALRAVEILEEKYPVAKCSLKYETPFQLLVATRLSAQCTDERVNKVTPALFEKFPDAAAFAKADISEVGEYIKSCGLYKTKAKDICAASEIIEREYGGNLPKTLEELVKLPGIGRKTANLICGDIYKMPAVVTDTHCIRITNRLGLIKDTDPKKAEFALRKILPKEKSSDFCHRIVLFGREVCSARNPKCEDCPLGGICFENSVNLKRKGKI